MDTLTTMEVARAAEQGCELGTVKVRDASGGVLDGTFTRLNGEWRYTGKLFDSGKLISVTGLVMSPFAGRVLDEIHDHIQQRKPKLSALE